MTKSGKKRKVCKECESNAEVIKQLTHDGIVLQRQLDAVAKEEWDALKEEISKLRKSLEVAREALEWYAMAREGTEDGRKITLTIDASVAKAALASLSGKEEK